MKNSFDNVSTFFLLEVHIKNIFKHQPTNYTSNQLCVYDIVRSHFCLVRILPVKEPVQNSSESLRQRILSIFMVSESHNCYYSLILFLPRPNITPSVFPYLGVIRGHKAQYYPTVFSPNGVKETHIIFHIMAPIICNIFLILV